MNLESCGGLNFPSGALRVSPRWEAPDTVASFQKAAPNEVLLSWARERWQQSASALRVLDIGGGAARNALPLAQLGCEVYCTDLALAMLLAARARVAAAHSRVGLVHASMMPLPFRDESFDMVVAHGVWNLANTCAEFRGAVREAARVARPGAGLFLFTFSRHTIGEDDLPLAGQEWVFSQFNGEPQCFLTERQIVEELAQAGWQRDSAAPLTEYNCPPQPRRVTSSPPVLYEGTFVRR